MKQYPEYVHKAMANRLINSITRRQDGTWQDTTKLAIMFGELQGYPAWMPHRYPRWLGLKLHITIEEVIMKLPIKMRASDWNIPLHIIHGIICDYPMRSIIKYLRGYWYGSDRGLAPRQDPEMGRNR